MNIEMFRFKKNTVKSFLDFIFGSHINHGVVRMRKEHSYGRKVLKLRREAKQCTTWSDAAFCGVCSGSALFDYELPPNVSSAYNLCEQFGPRAGPIGQDCLIL